MLAPLKIWGSILRRGNHFFLVFLYEVTQVFTQKLQWKTRARNTSGTRERELTESRVQHEFNTRVLGSLSSCSARWDHGILFTGLVSDAVYVFCGVWFVS